MKQLKEWQYEWIKIKQDHGCKLAVINAAKVLKGLPIVISEPDMPEPPFEKSFIPRNVSPLFHCFRKSKIWFVS